MSDPAGWFPAYRRVFEPDHWLAPTKRDPASRRDAWFDLCQMATWQPRETRSSGILQRGELVCSVRTLARRWCWHRCKVERFVSELKTRTAIETVNETLDGTVYRIVNYDTYAVTTHGNRDTIRDTKRDSGETAARQEQEVKNQKRTTSTCVGWPISPLKQDGNYVFPDEFETAWKEYPRREGGSQKVKAYQAFRRRVVAGDKPESLAIAAGRYHAECLQGGKIGTRFVQMAATFWGPSEPWRDYVDPPGNGNGTVRNSLANPNDAIPADFEEGGMYYYPPSHA